MSAKRECPTCRTTYTGDDKLFCPRDGTRLIESAKPPPEDTLVGRVIAGRFVLERRLGKGGMGLVYLANHNVLRRMFAVKLLRREFVSNERALARFFREARVASSVDHPNIVSIYDYGQTEKGEPYLVMEYVEGTLLYKHVVESRTRNLLPLSAVDIALQVARALEHAHQRGVVHRDIKPENILLTTFNGQPNWVKVLDFGVARVVGQPPLTRVGEEIIGTPEFIAPEMMTATGDVMPSVDLYALGIMLHDTIVGEPPFRGDIKEILQGHLNVVPPKLSERRRDVQIPRELDELVAQLLEKVPARRPGAAETVQRLEMIRTQLPSRAAAAVHAVGEGGARSDGTREWRDNATLILAPDQRGTDQIQGATTMILPAAAAAMEVTALSEPAKLSEIDALQAELAAAVARLGEHVDPLAAVAWPSGWPIEAQALRQRLADLDLAEETRGLRVAMLQDQMTQQQGRVDRERQELRQQILALSDRYQIDRALSDADRKQIQRSIEDKERQLAVVLQGAPTSPEPELNQLRRELWELRLDARRGWQQLALMALAATLPAATTPGAAPPEALAALLAQRSAVEQILGQIDTAQSMLSLLTRPATPRLF
ncbi:MAG: protein kinase [Polyangia bacterium]